MRMPVASTSTFFRHPSPPTCALNAANKPSEAPSTSTRPSRTRICSGTRRRFRRSRTRGRRRRGSGTHPGLRQARIPGFSYYIQTLDVTHRPSSRTAPAQPAPGRPTAQLPNAASGLSQAHITSESKTEGDVDVDLGPLKSISRLHARIFYYTGPSIHPIPLSSTAPRPQPCFQRYERSSERRSLPHHFACFPQPCQRRTPRRHRFGFRVRSLQASLGAEPSMAMASSCSWSSDATAHSSMTSGSRRAVSSCSANAQRSRSQSASSTLSSRPNRRSSPQ